jgi:hypothetical protein
MTRIASVIACDDVAAAGLGKLAFIGIYGGEILVPQLPYTFEKLFFVVRFRTPVDDLPKRLVVRIERPGVEPFIMDQSAALDGRTPRRPDATFFEAQAIIRLAPFHIDQEGTARVYVDDERGENYAGGIRVRVGTHPDLAAPHVAQAAMLVAGHYKRLSDAPPADKQETATQLIEALSASITNTGAATDLAFPEKDMRLLVGGNRIHVFFPKPLNDAPLTIELEPAPTFEDWEIERVDRIGFVVRFEPSPPADFNFNYQIIYRETETSERPPPRDSKTTTRGRAKRQSKSKKVSDKRR